ncbi:fibronectin-like [Haemaphysalis longicornis]
MGASVKYAATLVVLALASLGAQAANLGHLEDGQSRIYKREVFDSSHESLQISRLEATARGGNRARVRWDNATGPVSGYEITVCAVRQPPQCHNEKSQKNDINLVYLESGTTYEVDVRAYLKTGGDKFNGRTERTRFTTATLPSVNELQARPTGPTTVEVQWAPTQEPVFHYDVEACPADGGACVLAKTQNTTIGFEDLTPATTYTIRVRSATQEDEELAFGPRSKISATTEPLPPLSGVSVRATCDSFIVASWNYSVEGITGFELNLCTDGLECVTRSVDKSDREHSFTVDPVMRHYALSLEAYLWRGNSKHGSPVENVSITSFPEVSTVDTFNAEVISANEVKATWASPPDSDVTLRLCIVDAPQENCLKHVAEGSAQSHTFSGLSPNTKYSVQASGSVTIGGITCVGREAVREVTTSA